jgi:hypothetical protein
MVACTSELPATHQPTARPATQKATPTAAHHRALRYSAAGKTTVKNRARSAHAGVCVPVTADRARATSDDSRPTSAGSGEADRTTDRWVATRW